MVFAMEFMSSKHGKNYFFIFYKDHEMKEGVKWKCTNKKFSTKLYTDENAPIILKSDWTHNHAQDENLARQIISNSSKSKAEGNIFEKNSKIMKEVIINSPRSEKINIQDTEYIRKNMYRARREEYPCIPEKLDENSFFI